jgi:transposase
MLAKRGALPELTAVAKTILRHAKGILAHITHRVTNAAAESLSARIRTTKSPSPISRI